MLQPALSAPFRHVQQLLLNQAEVGEIRTSSAGPNNPSRTGRRHLPRITRFGQPERSLDDSRSARATES